MEFFFTEAERKKKHTTCCFEFQKGRFRDRFWCEDSICLDANLFDQLHLYELFAAAMPHFEYYGRTEVNDRDWQMLWRLSCERGGVEKQLVSELTPWAEACFENGEVFTICGI